MHLTTDMHTDNCTQKYTIIPRKCVRFDSERWKAMKQEIPYRWKVKTTMEQITAHIHTPDAQMTVEMSGIKAALEMENVCLTAVSLHDPCL